MPTYVGLYNWTEQGAKNVKDTVTRVQQAREAFGRTGGKITAVYWTQGPYDVVAIGEWPDEETANAAFLALGMQGNVRTLTMRAFNEQEMQRILAKVP